MKRLGLLILAVVSMGAWLAPVRGQQSDAVNYVPGEMIVKFARGVSASRRQAVMAGKSSTIVRRFDNLELDHVRLPPGKSVTTALAELRGNPEIVFAQPNYTYEATELAMAPAPPNDPYWLNDSLWGMQKIAAQQAWTAFGGGNGTIIIADIDTGVLYTHPDLAANMWRNPGEIAGNGIDDDHNNYVDDVYGIDTYNHDSNPIDDNSHGTHTAGTVAAVGNNGVGVVGVNWNARILACKFLSRAGSGSDAGAIECFDYITALKNRGENIRVSTNSWGGPRGSGVDAALQIAMDAAGNAGILNICAAGNSGTNNDSAPFDPASFTSSSIVSVAASDSSDNRAGFSNYGVTSVDLAAPGVNIYSTILSGYDVKSGTSMATPHVAGVAALVASMAPSLNADQLKIVLMQNTDVLPQWAGVVASGGRLNAFKAASAVATAPADHVNVALASNGGTALASSTYSGAYPAASAVNGDRRGVGWGSGGGWNDATGGGWPDWLEVDFSGTRTIGEIDVFTLQDNFQGPIEPSVSTTFSAYGIRDFSVQYWNGSTWAALPGGAVTNNTLVWRQFTFAPLSTTKIRVWVTSALGGYSRITEVEAYSASGSNAPPTVSLTSPASGSTLSAPATIGITATADDSDGTVSSVAFYANGNLLGTDTANPYAFTWSNVSAGTYSLTAIATDNSGAATTSAAVDVTVSASAGGGINVALASNGGTSLASSAYSANYPASSVINGDRRGTGWGAGGGWNDASGNGWPDWIEVDFASAQAINEIDVFTLQDAFGNPATPTPAMTFSSYGIRDFDVQYWTGSAWLVVPNGTVANNNLVWRQFTFAPLTTQKIRVWVNNALNAYSRITEVEAYSAGGTPPNTAPSATITGPTDGSSFTAPSTISLTANASDSDGSVASVSFYANGAFLATDTTSPYGFSWPSVAAGTYVITAVATDNLGATGASTPVTITVSPTAGSNLNVALASNGGVATASSFYSGSFPTSAVIDGDRRGLNWGSGGGWNDGTAGLWPDWVQIDFSGTQTIGEVDVFTVQDAYSSPAAPTSAMTFNLYGIRDFEVQYWNGTAWLPVPGGAASNNNLVWRQFTFSPVTTPKIRVWITNSLASYSRITEIEAYTSTGATQPPATVPSTITLRADLVGTYLPDSNATSPLTAGSSLLLLTQTGTLSRWTGSTGQPILTVGAAPPGVTPFGNEAFLNAAANTAGTQLFVMFTSSTSPPGVPQRVSPRPGADAWQVLYRYDFNGTALSNPQGIVSLQVRIDGHTGGGMAVMSDGAVLFATGDNGDAGEDGRAYAQNVSNHLSKVLRIDPANSAVTVLAAGVRNVQRLFVNPNSGDPRLEFIDIGGAIAEEFNSVQLADLLASVKNFGWGRNAGDNLAREGTFYIDPAGAVVGVAPTPEAGFVQPIAQFGREGAQFVAGTGTVSSTASFTNISAVFGDLPSGNVFAVTGTPGAANQTVYRVNLVDSGSQPVTLAGLAGGRPDPRFFLFPDGTAGVLLEKTGAFYRLTQIAQ